MASKKTGRKPRSTSGLAEQTGTELSNSSQFPIVGVGASAGGLEAFTQLFRNLPVDPGMAFILIQHLAPAHESMLTELLSKVTAMPVTEVKDGITVKPDNVYVIPPDSEMIIFQGVLHLMPRGKAKGQYMPVDSFLRSLAQDRRNNVIAIIMSGTGSDGSMGIRAVKGEGGIVFAQDETSKYDGMPKSAIDTGCVDFALPPDKIAAELLRIRRHPYLAAVPQGEAVQIIPAQESDLNKIFILLRSAKGVDFTSYRRSTIMRRVNRRMLLQKIEGMEKYVAYLKENPSEIETLYQDILINVTSFFREPEAFEALKRTVFPHIVKKASVDIPVRIWVPACSTGEEAYSIAIALIEYMDDNKISRPVQLFATDIDDLAVDKARKGIYPENISRDVSPERLSRFFEKTGGGYVIKKFVREMCIFAKQNIVKDPPFSKLDLISCRNVLIYFGPELQKKAVRILFYALSPRGFLMIGPSETVGEFAGFFLVVDKKHTIYAKKAEQSGPYFEVAAVEYGTEKAVGKKAEVQSAGIFDIQKEADTIVLTQYSPAGFVVNDAMKILQFRGDTGPYLRPAPGEASLNLLKMVSEDLVAELRTALHQAKKEDAPVRKERARVKPGRGGVTPPLLVNIDVVPFKAPVTGERCFLVLFEETGKSPIAVAGLKGRGRGRVTPPVQDEETVQLRQELAESKAHLHTVTQEYEAANEELRALNEELQSSNEEMQSINEEMETAKEELQSTNEELTTVNDELQSRNEETTQLNNDLFNVLRGVEIPIVLLGSQLQIRRFNDAAARLLNLIPSDAGRPLSNIRTNINIPDLEQMVLDTISTLAVKEKEVQDTEGSWYSLAVRPYKTVDNRIDGVLMTLVDINDIKRTLLRVEVAYDYANAIVETVHESLLVLDPDLRVMTANKSFYENFLAVPEATEGRYIYELGNGQWNIPDLMKQLQEVLPEKKSFSDFEVTIESPNAGRRVMILNARKIYLKEPYFKAGLNMTEHFDRLILLAIEDITERKQTEEALLKSNAFNQSIIDNSTDCIKLLDLEGRLQYMSPGGQRRLGIQDMGKYLNVPYQEFWKGTDHQAALEAIHQARQGHPGTFQGYCPTVDGTPKWWDVAISPIVGADGNPERLLAVSRDITEHRRAAEALQKAKDKLEIRVQERTADLVKINQDLEAEIAERTLAEEAQKQAEKEIIKINQELEQRVIARTAELEAVNKELEAFSYTVSHDLKTPLRSIQGFAQAIAEDYSDKLDDAGRDYLRRLTSAGKRMTQLIDAMLSISRLTTHALMENPVNLSSLAEVIAHELKKNEPGRTAEFIIAKGVKAHGDADMLEIAMRNLFDNAWKFTGKHASARIEFGVIECGVRNAECGTIPNSETGKTVYFVSDDGSGFSMQFADKLFQPFKRLHSESEFPGLGIGLATVSKIINKHGGKIWAEAEPEKGATFYFTLG